MSRFPGSLALVSRPALLNGQFAATARNTALCALGCVAFLGSQALAQTATTTTLAITSGGSALTTVPFGSVVTLTATVTAGATPVSPGQVKFCDATAAHCEDIHFLGTAQLTSAGIATFKFRPGAGSHTYNAVFLATPNSSTPRAGSTSSNGSLTVTAPTAYPSVTQMSVAGSTGTYQLGATVSGIGPAPPTGTVSFLDTSNGNAQLATASIGSSSSSINFANISNPAAGLGPSAIAVADFNLDGIPDIAIANDGGAFGTLTILLGNGDGTFTPAPSPAAGFVPMAVVAGDFNGDGIPDLAVGSDGNLTILLGNGDGTFAAAASPNLGDDFNVTALAVGDFNGDGNLDLVVLGSGVVIFLGHGDGTFAEANGSPITLVNNPPNSFLWSLNALAIADFNGDGKLDIATADSDMCDINCGGTQFLTILLGNGDGTFAASPIVTPVNEFVNEDPISIVAADLNGDGIPDLAVSASDGLNVLLGNGNGTFTPLSPASLGDGPGYIGPGYIAVGDLNGDGIPDLAVAIANGPVLPPDYGVVVLLGKGDGTFTSQTSQAAGSSPTLNGIAVADFNGDGVPDVAAPNFSSNTAIVLLTETQFASTPQIPITLNGVGIDLVEASYTGDAIYTASTSASAALNLSSPAPTVALTVSARTIAYGTSETLTIQVTGSGPTATGGVNIYNGTPGATAQLIASGVPLVNGVATYTSTTIEGGTYSLIADYTGDSNYPGANSSAVSLTINPTTPPVIWPQPSTNPIPYGTPLSQVLPSGTGPNVPLQGTYSYQPSILSVPSVGTDTITVTFNPADTNDYTTATNTLTVTVIKGTPDITLVTPTGSGQYQFPSPITFNVNVIVLLQGTPTGTVSFYDGGTLLGSSTLTNPLGSSGTATFTISTLTPGSHSITAAYSGDSNCMPVTSGPVTVTVAMAAPAIALTTSAPSAFVSNPVTFTATVTSPAGTPTGTVRFFDGTSLLGTATMASGVATYQTAALLAGTHSITAVYSGDTNFLTETSSALSQVIENFTLAASGGGTASVTASPGGQAAYSFTVTPPTGAAFAGPISFNVTGLPAGATAAFSPATVPAGAGATTVTMTVTLPMSALARPANRPFSGGTLPLALGLILFPFLGLPFAGRLRRAARGWKGTVCLLVVGLALAAGLTSCAGSVSSGGLSSTPQTYILTVTASAGPLSNVSTVELVVQ